MVQPGTKPSRDPARRGPRGQPSFLGWFSTDAEEIERRRLRASLEPLSVHVLESPDGSHGDYAVRSRAGETPYRVQIRSLDKAENTCSCPDHRTNGLGTCKHIEAVLLHLRRKGARRLALAAERGSPYVEVYLRRGGEPQVRVAWPRNTDAAVRRTVGPFFGSGGALLAPPAEGVPALKRAVARAAAGVRGAVRLAPDAEDWAADQARRAARARARDEFLADVRAGKQSLDLVRAKLLPYQQDGTLHLAFGERALLADEMGLGKTVQAIAACELLRRLRRIERVLVVSPASLKAEWEEQIGKFTGLPSRVIWGPRAARLTHYRAASFFYLCNYEQVISDLKDINQIVAPDVVILDEAQRIKNWQTRTARTIKRLSSPYAFVLTGTPLENRIDEIYSIVEFLDPTVFGPLFRFNREFYQLDEKGRPAGYRNLEELHRRLRPVMLRRRKDEVEEQLPPRTVKNYFVGMEAEQRARYEEYGDRVARLLAVTRRRPLTADEMEKLQRWLACMRMICDTPFILDPDCRICPKLTELASILEETLAEPDAKALVFSEWERMLHLVRDQVRAMKIGFAWHTGSVPQHLRRADIVRFKQDPACRLFLSSDAGATGLNLQAANVVINLDLPWNPARLEQRIARAWRKYQARSVRVINLVCEDSIEHRMLGMLSQKQQLADGVLDGRGDLAALKMPSGRAALMERLQTLMGGAPPPAPRKAPETPRGGDPWERFHQDLVGRLDARLLLLESHGTAAGRRSLLAVVDGPADQVRPLAERLLRESFAGAAEPPALELLDRTTYETIRKLLDAGVLKLGGPERRTLHAHPALGAAGDDQRERRRQAAQRLMGDAGRKAKMSAVLKEGGFPAEALPSLREATELALKALLCLVRGEGEAGAAEPVPLTVVESELARDGALASESVGVLARLREWTAQPGAQDERIPVALWAEGRRLFAEAEVAVSKQALS